MGRTLKPQPDSVCCVIGCVNHEFISDDERFYRFPTQVLQRTKWIEAVRKINGVDANGIPWTPSNISIICCLHFVKHHTSRNPWSENYCPTVFSQEAYSKELNSSIESCTIPVDDESSFEEETPIATDAQQLLELCPQTSPINTKKQIQLQFIDHVVLGYLNRCRSRAGRTNIGMPHYILKAKAEQAAVLLGTQIGCRYQWFEKFKKYLAENDAKRTDLTSLPQSLIVADIMIDEWPKFAKLKGLDIVDASDASIILVDEQVDPLQTEDVMTAIDNPGETQIQNKDLASDPLRPISPVIEEEANIQISQSQNVTNQEIRQSISQEEFLRHVWTIFIRRFTATFPQAELPDSILNAKLREAALNLGCSSRKRKHWVSEYKRSLLPNCSTDCESISAEPNQSLEMSDIIAEERPKFDFQNDITSSSNDITSGENIKLPVVPCKTLKSKIVKTEQINSEHSDGIQVQTYKEARDCLNLLNNYAIKQGDLSAFSLIKQIDTFLRSEDCED